MELYLGKSPILLKHINLDKQLLLTKICDGKTAQLEDLYEADLVINYHLFIKNRLLHHENPEQIPHLLLLHNPYVILMGEKPCDIQDKQTQESDLNQMTKNITASSTHFDETAYIKVLNCHYESLAQKAQKVSYLDSQGILCHYKETSPYIFCAFIRHGKTLGNLSHQYIGRTDQDLCELGISELKMRKAQLHYPLSTTLFMSPMKRCMQTAGLLYPELKGTLLHALRECDFGRFECKNYKDLTGTPDYQKWVDSNGTLPFPDGESPSDFTARCVQGFLECISALATPRPHHQTKWTTFVIHGGTIMSIFSELAQPKGDYFSYQVSNGDGYLCAYELATQTLYPLACIKS